MKQEPLPPPRIPREVSDPIKGIAWGIGLSLVFWALILTWIKLA